MSSDAAAAGAPPCDFCAGMPAVVYCRADSARLCLPCDRLVHGANTVSTRHARAPLCAACSAAAAAFRRGSFLLLCGNCDFEERERDGAPGSASESQPPRLLHDRGAVEWYTGCPSIGDLAAVLGVVVGGYEKAAGGGDGWRPAASTCWDWEEPRVLRLEDVIVPTTSCHGLQPLVTPAASPTDHRSAVVVGKQHEEVIRQLGDLAKAEAAGAGVEPAADDGVRLTSWVSSESAIIGGHAGFKAFNPPEAACQEEEATSMAATCCEHEAWIATPDAAPSDDAARRRGMTSSLEAPHGPAPAAEAEPCLSAFVATSQIICPSTSNVDAGKRDPAAAQAVLPPAKAGGYYDVAYPDRGTVISRYKEKRKNRRFGKQIRYESRKARADGRLRIKGRFAKAKETEG